MLEKISLENFRNHKKFELGLGEITVLVGKNGVGKSNILEAISILSSCRSFREDDKKNFINIESSFGRIKGDELEVFLQKEPILLMKAKEKGVFKKHAAFVGLLRSVTFSPETMLLATGSPKNRRKFIDMMISQKDPDYLAAIIAYEKIRKERNSLLDQIQQRRAKEDELSFWDENLVKEGTVIIKKRQAALEFFGKIISQIYQNISGKNTDILELSYDTTEDLINDLQKNRQKEIWQGRTLYGPHRDDLVISLNSKPISSFASRGEIRSAILSLKIAELEFLKDKSDKAPILLLDDVFSEFDDSRRNHLGDLVCKYQCVITTTDESHLSTELLKKAKVIKL